jgi:hypothetical protein
MCLGIGLARPERVKLCGNPKNHGKINFDVSEFWNTPLCSHLDIYQLSVSGLAAKYGDILCNSERIGQIFLEEFQAPTPDLVVFWIGMNDCRTVYNRTRQDDGPRIEVAHILDSIKEVMIEVQQHVGPNASILWVGPGSASKPSANEKATPAPTAKQTYSKANHKDCPYSNLVNNLNSRARAKSINRDGVLDPEFPKLKFRKMCHIRKCDLKDKWNHLSKGVRSHAARNLMNLINHELFG